MKLYSVQSRAAICFPMFLLLLGQCGIGWAAQPPQLQIVILDGQDALNNIHDRTAREPIVQVQDENHKPVAGAVVIFLVRSDNGASGTFANGLTTYTTRTDSLGRAVGRGFTHNDVAGDLVIAVEATYMGMTADTVIHQTNISSQKTNSSSSSTRTTGTNVRQPRQTGGRFSSLHLGEVLELGGFAAASIVIIVNANALGGSNASSIQLGTGGVGQPVLRKHK